MCDNMTQLKEISLHVYVTTFPVEWNVHILCYSLHAMHVARMEQPHNLHMCNNYFMVSNNFLLFTCVYPIAINS